MKLVLKIVVILALLYALAWGGLAAYFSYAGYHKGLLESNLSSFFKRSVTIAEFDTVWRGLSPCIYIEGFVVEGDVEGEPAMAFKSLSAELSPLSLIRLWPKFTEFSVESPSIEIVSLDTDRLQVAGIELKQNSARGIDPRRLITWIMDQKSARWKNGQIVWRRLNGENQLYQDISFEFARENQFRLVKAAITTPKGAIAFKAQSHGDLFADDDWDASLEVLGNKGEPLLNPDDLSLRVVDGQGQLKLKKLDVQRIRDFIRLTGLASNAGWLLDAQLSGYLHDMQFAFSGPLFRIDEWSLDASASDIGFKSTGRAPAMNKLAGSLNASANGGKFVFSTKDSLFEWARWFETDFSITGAKGEFGWQISEDRKITISLRDGEFEDQVARIFNINASVEIGDQVRRISNFGQLFKVESVADLDYDDGEIVELSGVGGKQAPLYLDATAEFEVFKMADFDKYLPKKRPLENFRVWWDNAFIAGSVHNGKASYKGELSGNAMDVGKAKLNATADFKDVVIDYGYQRSWPMVEKARGSARMQNGLLSITPDEIFLGGDLVTGAELQIYSLFKKNLRLDLQGAVSMGLPKGLDFLFKGPLIAADKIPQELPVTADQGSVDIQASVRLLLNNLAAAEVEGTAAVKNGRVFLPGNVPIENLNATVEFTERSVKADAVRATFLGGETLAKVVTVQEAQPPKMKLTGSGIAKTDYLEPWVGEHVLTWIDGETPWQGTVLIDDANITVDGQSNLKGIAVTAPAPLAKQAEQKARFSLSMVAGAEGVQQRLSINYKDLMRVRMRANAGTQGSLFDNALIAVGGDSKAVLKEGVNFDIQYDTIDLDEWMTAIIDIAQYQPQNPTQDTEFLDAMRSVKVRAKDPVLLNRDFGPIDVSMLSVDGAYWIGTIKGKNANGTMQLEPRADIGSYAFNLSSLNLDEERELGLPLDPVDYSLETESFPALSVIVDNFQLTGKNLGRVEFVGKPTEGAWELSKFEMRHRGIFTQASGQWVNNSEAGSMSSFDFDTKIEEAEGVLDDISLDGFIKKGKGSIKGNLRWIGAPHEFDYSRLNGDFDMRIRDGELVKVEPGGGKLLGLLNFNAIARRITFDFRDVFASGLTFDRMQYTGLFSNGEAIMRDAFIFTPAVFVRMEGKVDLDKELIDMEIHMSPELGGNLTLLSALANPAAGAVVFITQQIFKSEMRSASFRSYRALGTWEDFEMVEFGDDGIKVKEAKSDQPEVDIPVKDETNGEDLNAGDIDIKQQLDQAKESEIGRSEREDKVNSVVN